MFVVNIGLFFYLKLNFSSSLSKRKNVLGMYG